MGTSCSWIQRPAGMEFSDFPGPRILLSSRHSDLVSIFCVSACSHCQSAGHGWAVWISEEVSYRPRSTLQRYLGTVSKREGGAFTSSPFSEAEKLVRITVYPAWDQNGNTLFFHVFYLIWNNLDILHIFCSFNLFEVSPVFR